ncbi:MAG: amidohydrolase [Gemmataceae bacterium]
MERRAFLLSTAASVAALSARAEDSDGLYNGNIVDTHQHLWDLEMFRLPWVANLKGEAKKILDRSYTLADYAEASKGLKVTKSVYMEVDVALQHQIKEADYVTAICKEGKSTMQGAVISGRPAADNFAKYLNLFKDNQYIKGLRQVLHTPATPDHFCLEEKFVKGVQLLGERKLSFDLCLRGDQLDDGAKLVEQCPNTRFILDHCGNPHAGKADLPTWEKGLKRVAANKNVICKVSGIYGNVSHKDWPADKLAPVVRTVIDTFGWDRVIFASDWPVVNLGGSFAIWVNTLKQIVKKDSAENQKKLFHDNAVRFYGLT